jgi:hypothetical protein
MVMVHHSETPWNCIKKISTKNKPINKSKVKVKGEH